MAPNKEFKCPKCDKEYCFEKGLTAHMNKNHDDNVPKGPTNQTKASKPASNTGKNNSLKCLKCDTKCTDNDVLKKHMQREHSPKNVWTVSPNLNTKELDDLIEEEEELANHGDQMEHAIGINASAAEWHAVNFDSPFGNSGEFSGRNAIVIGEQKKCESCEVNSQTFEKQRGLLMKQDRQISESLKSQKDQNTQNNYLKKKLEDATNLVGHTKIENINLKVELQLQKDLVMALKIKLEDANLNLGEVMKEPSEIVIIKEAKNASNEEGPLPESEQKCDKCNYRNKNRVLLQAHKDKRHSEIMRQKCCMCGHISTGPKSIREHKQQHEEELNVGRISDYPIRPVEDSAQQAAKQPQAKSTPPDTAALGT